MDAYSALIKLPKPDIYLADYYIFDDVSISEKNNGDGIADAGETLHIAPILFNQWGMSRDTVITIDVVGPMGVDNPYVEIITASSDFESVGTYSTKDQLLRDDNGLIVGAAEPLIVKIKDNCPNDYYIQINVSLTYRNGLMEEDTTEYRKSSHEGTISLVNIGVRNGTKFPSIIEEDIVIDSNKLYILDGTCIIFKDVTVTIKENVQIQNLGTIKVYGELLVEGTEEKPVIFTGNGRLETQESGTIRLNYAKIDGTATITEMVNSRFEGGELICANVITKSEVVASKIQVPFIEDSQITIRGSSPYGDAICGIGMKGCAVFGDASIKMNTCESSVFYNKCYFYNLMQFSACVFFDHSMSPKRLNCHTIGDSYFWQNTQTQTTYVVIWAPGANPYLFDILSEALGGSPLCIESEEEWKFVKDHCMYGICGLEYGSEKWINGTDVGDWLPLHYAQNMEHLLRYAEHESVGFGVLSFEGASPRDQIIFEIPNSLDLTTEKIDNLLNSDTDLQEYHRYMNCSFVTNFNDLDNLVRAVAYERSYENIQNVKIPNIYWGTTDPTLIEAQILDFDDEPYLRDQIDPSGFLTEAPADAYSFVVDAYILNQDGERVRTVNNETVTFVVEFNRDMDVSVPLKVTFGSSAEYFHEDYNISEYGKFVTPRRWEATYTLKTLIENGNHTIKIENGCAADNEWLKLYDVPGRFQFEIDTTVAQALIMQGYATEKGIQLSWTQDDFDTLFGYNVYRAESGSSKYMRLNSTVIHYDTKEFFDGTVDALKTYDYYFTVVGTDLSESEPSGKISIVSLDTIAPVIEHTPVTKAYLGSNLTVRATVTDNMGVREVKLYYRAVGQTEWKTANMSGTGGRYSAVIYGDMISGAGIEYYICAYDGISYAYAGSADVPFQVAVEHTFGEWTQTIAPGCTTPGEETRTCTTCGYCETRTIEETGHTEQPVPAKAPTCTEIGWDAYVTCSRCDYTTYTEKAALGHNYADGMCTGCDEKQMFTMTWIVDGNSFTTQVAYGEQIVLPDVPEKEGFVFDCWEGYTAGIIATEDMTFTAIWLDYIYGDVNGDGQINGRDVILLRKYMANYDYDTGESTIVLGPQD